MTPLIGQIRQRQESELAACFGALPHARLCLDVTGRFLGELERALAQERMGEVVLVLRRGNGDALLHTKTFYPDGAYRLLSGGIQGGEEVMVAAKREAAEETGLALECARPLGLITYDVYAGDKHTDFHSWLVTATVEGEARPADPDERIEGYHWIEIERLTDVAAELRSLPPDWASWGHFRALAHDLTPRWLEEVGYA